jgi:carbamate kinase
VIALGQAALLDPGETLDADRQRRHINAAAAAVAGIARHHEVVVTHGSAAQVGLLGVQSATHPSVDEYPLDLLDAEAEGLVGYLLQQALANQLREKEVVTLLTQVVVDPADRAIAIPDKRIGPPLAEVDAFRLARDRYWFVAAEHGGFRRVVSSPEPLAIVELRTIKRLMSAGVVVVCAGGGGIPVVLDTDGALRGVAALIDKDRTAALLATLVEADVLLLLTDVPAVVAERGSASARPIGQATPAELRALNLDPATMAPKVVAACRFVEQTAHRAAIGRIADAEALLEGTAGTQVTPEPGATRRHPSGFDAGLLATLWSRNECSAEHPRR